MNLPPEPDRLPAGDTPAHRGKPVDGPTVEQLQEGLGDDFQVRRVLGQGAIGIEDRKSNGPETALSRRVAQLLVKDGPRGRGAWGVRGKALLRAQALPVRRD